MCNHEGANPFLLRQNATLFRNAENHLLRQRSFGKKRSVFLYCYRYKAGMAELVYAPDLGSGGETRGGSSPSTRTKN